MKVCLIPARGGSKRIPRKNIKLFHGKPIISYSIKTALNSGCFDKVIVSTDDGEIADLASKEGANIPFIRPRNVSNDYATTVDVLKHFIDWCYENTWQVEAICCIYATAPFLTEDTIRKSYKIFKNNKCEYVFSIVPYEYSVQRSLRVNQDGRISMLNPDMINARSQDLEPIYHDAGQFYWCNVDALNSDVPIFSDKSMPYVLPRYAALDIDTEEDWMIAEKMYSVFNDK